jgi:glycerate 2-kinase
MDAHTARQVLLACFAAAVRAVDPERAVVENLRVDEVSGRLVVLALGKAAPAMARGAARALGRVELEGIAVSNHRDDVPSGIELKLGSHPVPDQSSLDSGLALLDLAESLGEDDMAIALISGGGSALAEVPVTGVSLADLAAVNQLLLLCGADIDQTNTVRRRLSRFKGGGLAAAVAPARLVTLLVSDVIGDSPATIASGPTFPANDDPGAALAVVQSLRLEDRLPPSVMTVLQQSTDPEPAPAYGETKVVASGAVAAHAAASAAAEQGLRATVIDTRFAGDAAEAAGEALQRSVLGVSVFAGETTVDVSGGGIGGRSQEAALVMATLIEERSDVYFLAAGTDGIDGTTRAAGAFVDGGTVRRCRDAEIDVNNVLDRNDSGTLFAAIGDDVVTGPTGTNVGDIWLVLRSG